MGLLDPVELFLQYNRRRNAQQTRLAHPSHSSRSPLFCSWPCVYLQIVIIFFVVNVSNNRVLGFDLPFPLIIVFRSSTLIANVLLTWLLQNRTFSLGRVCSVLLVSVGIALFTLFTHRQRAVGLGRSEDGSDLTDQSPLLSSTMAGQRLSFTLGILVLSVSSFASAYLGIVQERVFMRYGKHPEEMMFTVHFLSLPLFAFVANEIQSDFAEYVEKSLPVDLFIAKVPNNFLSLAAILILQLICVRSVYRLAAETTSLQVSMTLALRKFLNIIFSVIIFKNEFGMGHAIATEAPRIVHTYVSAKGLPAIVLSSGDAFVYSLPLQSWLSFLVDHELIASKLCSMQLVAKTLPDGLIAALLRASKTEKPSSFVPQRAEMAAAKEESELEMLLRMTRELDSWEEYRFLTAIYVQLLLSRGKRAKLVEFLEELRSLSQTHSELPFSKIAADLSPLIVKEGGIDAERLLNFVGKGTEKTSNAPLSPSRANPPDEQIAQKWPNVPTSKANCSFEGSSSHNGSATTYEKYEEEQQRLPPLPELNLESTSKLRQVPQLCHLQNIAKLELPVPQPQKELELRLKLGFGAQIDRIIVQNSLSNKRTLKSARIIAKFGRETKWCHTVPSPALLIKSNRFWTVLFLEDKTFIVLHSQSGRVSCSLRNQSALALLELRDNFCLAVSTETVAQVWDLQRSRSIFRTSIRSLFGYTTGRRSVSRTALGSFKDEWEA
uniref:Hira domain-containing protein n=1 Tax=Globodera pallida TaxID=36090 RepID=A0A183BZB8_GLOPA